MNCEKLKEQALNALPILFACDEDEEGRLRINTPYLYPDGDYIDLYFVQTPTGQYLTDLGETTGYLGDHGIGLKQSPKRWKIVNDILLTQGIEFFQGELRVSVEQWDKAAWLVTRLSQAIVQVSDLVFSLRSSALATFKEEVQEYWIESQFPFEVDYPIVGGSGESYKIDFYISTGRRPWLVETLSSQSQSYANSLVSRVVRTWHDLRRADGRYGYLSLIDDTTDIWKQEWHDQLSEFSQVVIWSERETLSSLLRTDISINPIRGGDVLRKMR